MPNDFQTTEYAKCVLEGATLIKEGKRIPSELIKRALGEPPICNCNDSPDTDTFVTSYCQIAKYQEAEKTFRDAILAASK